MAKKITAPAPKRKRKLSLKISNVEAAIQAIGKDIATLFATKGVHAAEVICAQMILLGASIDSSRPTPPPLEWMLLRVMLQRRVGEIRAHCVPPAKKKKAK